MAEIEIRKKSKPIWPWIIGILAVIAIVVWLIFRNSSTNPDANETSFLKATKESNVVLRKKTVFPEYVPIKLEAYLA